jgi:hypothetical protein
MNDDLRLERTATELLDAAAPSRAPVGLLADTVASVGRTRQRARWLAYLKEPPMRTPTGVAVGSPTVRRVSIALLTLALALGLTAAVAVGASQLLKTTELPPPFGLARNGLVAYAQEGDIYTVDPATGERRAIVSGPEEDLDPRWSLDGTRLLFLRSAGAEGQQVGIVDPDRPDKLVMTEAFDLDSDGVRWSPDGRSISFGSPAGVQIVDAATGTATPLDFDVPALDMYWRPPDGRQAMVISAEEPQGLYLLDLDDGTSKPVMAPGSGGIRTSGWTPDGRSFVYQRGEAWAPPWRLETHILDVTSGDDVVLDVGYGHVSNDGTRMVAHSWNPPRPPDGDQLPTDGMCVVELRGGDCIPVGEPHQLYLPAHGEGVHWSPDDRWLVTRDALEARDSPNDATAYLVDPDGEIVDQPSWISDGAVSWQRLAP